MNRSNVSCVKWVDFSDHMFTTFVEVYVNGLYTDVSLVLADGVQLSACRMVLSMASKFFEDIFQTAFTTVVTSCGSDGPHQDIIKVMIPDVTSAIMKHVLHFIYTGEVHMNARNMSEFFEACQLFRLKGLEYQNGNINGVKISGSNIITPEQYDYEEEMQETYVEGTTEAVVESEVSMVDPETSLEVAGETSFQPTEGHKGVVEAEPMNQYYEVMDMDEMEANGNCQEVKPILQTLVVRKEEQLMPAQEDDSDTETGENESSEASGLSKKRLKNCEYGERLDEAISTIITGGSSFRTASIQYGIPKTVLWRKAVKVPNYKAERGELPSPRKEAIEALKAGEKLLNISKRFDIPLSTLHRDKIKLYSEGALPDNVSLKQRDKGIDFKERVLEAAQQCVSGAMSQSEASKLYKLPKTTIWRKIKALKSADGGKGNEALESSSGGLINFKAELADGVEDNDDGSMGVEEHLDSEYVVLV